MAHIKFLYKILSFYFKYSSLLYEIKKEKLIKFFVQVPMPLEKPSVHKLPKKKKNLFSNG